MVRVRFERDVGCRAPRARASLFKRQSLGVLDPLVKILAFADNASFIIDDHTADERVWAYLSNSPRGQLKRAPHHASVKVQSPRSRVQGQNFHPKIQSPVPN